MLYPGGKGAGNTSDPYKTAVIDTIVAEVQSTPGDDRCVLLLGYKEQMDEMLENSNPGLARRFPLSYAFEFEDFDDEQLRQILELKLKDQGLDATEEAKNVAVASLSRARDRPNFGNAGEVENLISHAKGQEQKRRSVESTTKRTAEVVFLPQDFDENFDRAKDAALNCRKLFADVVGCEGLISKLERYQRVAASMRARGMDPRTQIPFNFIFKGPPGESTWNVTFVGRSLILFQELERRLLLERWAKCSMIWVYYRRRNTLIVRQQTSSVSMSGKQVPRRWAC